MELPLARILVVDDDRHVGATLRDLLLDLGYAVKNAVRGDEALRLIEVFCPDVVLLDLHLPGLPGAEVFERLRREHCLRQYRRWRGRSDAGDGCA